MYTTTQILTPPNGSEIEEKVIINHESMAALIEYLEFHNLLIGTPRAASPVVEVEHIDGSAITPDELSELDKRGINQEGYARRNKEGLDAVHEIKFK